MANSSCLAYLSSLDLQSFWSTDHPRFDPCFEKTVLIWIPCICVILFLPFYACSTNFDTILKILSWKSCTLCLSRKICLCLVFLISITRTIGILINGLSTYGLVDIVEVLSLVFLCQCFLILILCSKRSSIILYTINLALFCLFGIPEFWSKIISIHSGQYKYPINIFDIITYFIMYLGLLICLAVFVFPLRHGHECCQAVQNIKVWPEQSSSFFSRIFFGYMWKLYVKGYKKELILDDLWAMDCTEKAGHVNDTFMHRYKNYAKKYAWLKPGGLLALTAFVEHWKPFIISLILIIARELFAFMVLLDLRWLIGLASNSKEHRWHGFVYVAIFFVCQLCRILTMHHQHHEFTKIGIRLKSALASFVMKKSLRLSPDARREFGAGVITNLASVDAGQFLENITFTHLAWSAPFTVLLGLYFLYISVGSACWLGLAVVFLMALINGICGRFYNRFYGQEMIEKDKRLKMIAELLRIISVVKLYAWELAFKKFIDQIREREIRIIKKLYYLWGVNDFTWFSLTLYSMTAIFATYTLGFGQPLTPQVAFSVIIVASNFFIPLGYLPRAINAIIGIAIAFKRLDKFFAAQELNNYIKNVNEDNDIAISIQDARFIWDKGSNFNLHNITADIRKGDLIAIMGSVGAGKSSFLNAIAGEMYEVTGNTTIQGSIAYVPQQSWILNDTVKANILFNKPFDAHRYEKVLLACALMPDLEILPAGDMTEIGERGINLSGGQKQRISLARAIYQDKDIYLLDDPLSAVDVHVQQHLFKEVIGPHGLLKHKTRILATNATSFLPLCDHVMLFDNGKMIGFSPVTEIRSTSIMNPIQEFIRKEANADDQPESDSMEDIKKRQDKEPVAQDAGKLVAPEAMSSGMVSWSAYSLYIKSAGWPLFFAFFWKFLAFLCMTAAILCVQRWSDNVTKGTADSITNKLGVSVLAGACLIQMIFVTFYAIYSARFTARAAGKLHSDLLMRMLKSPMAIFNSTPSGRFLNRFSQDMIIIDNSLCLILSITFSLIVVFLTNVGPLFYASPILVAFFLPLAMILAILQKFYSKSARQLQRLEAISRSPVFSRLHDVLQGVDSIRIYRLQDIFSRAFDYMLDANAAAKLCLMTSQRWLTVNLNFLAIIVSSGAVVVALYTNISPGLFGLTVSCIVMIMAATQIVQQLCETEIAFVAMERLKEYFQLPQEAEWTKPQATSNIIPKLTIVTTGQKGDDEEMRTVLSESRMACHYEATGVSKLAKWPRSAEIEFRNFSLKYRPDLPFALKNLNLKIRDGEKVGIVGRTGAGKTSITAGLFRLVEAAEGQILIDSIDIASLGLHELRRKLTIIPQDPSIFSGTIRQNLDPFDEYSDQEVWSALEFSHLKSYVSNLPDGIEHKLDEGGSNLSMGQRQLVCLARALLRRSKILVLDEATASVDMETDQLIQETIRDQFKDCTVITIAHRLETIMDYDSVVVLSDGRVIEHGPVNDLLANPESHFSILASKRY